MEAQPDGNTAVENSFKWMTIFVMVLLLLARQVVLAQNDSLIVYLIPGQGSDYRIFEKLEWPAGCELRNIRYTVPKEGATMETYAHELSGQMDTCRPFIVVGVSLGGMLATEMADFLHAQKVIVISSAKCRNELPGRYRFQKHIPVYKLFPPGFIKSAAFVAQPLVEPDRNREKNTFEAMLEAKDAVFLQRAIVMIMEWERTAHSPKVVHIHGDHDHTLPIKNVDYDYILNGGSHMMTLTRAHEISAILRKEIEIVRAFTLGVEK